MPTKAPIHRPLGHESKAERNRRYDARRGSSTQRGYGPRWRKLRAMHLAANPLCVMCKAKGRVTGETLIMKMVVDHIVPKRQGGTDDPSNLQTLCQPHHDGAKQAYERISVKKGCDADGMPRDPNHRWRGG